MIHYMVSPRLCFVWVFFFGGYVEPPKRHEDLTHLFTKTENFTWFTTEIFTNWRQTTLYDNVQMQVLIIPIHYIIAKFWSFSVPYPSKNVLCLWYEIYNEQPIQRRLTFSFSIHDYSLCKSEWVHWTFMCTYTPDSFVSVLTIYI
jgi:hypothetical protein